jgi:hypothetical protein
MTALVLSIAVGLALGSDVKTEYKRSVDLNSLRRFALRDQPVNPIDTGKGPANSQERMREALVTELDARGFQYVPVENADFLVSLSVEEAGTEDGARSYAHSGSRLGDRGQGTIVVELFDPGNQLIWKGRISGTAKMDQSARELDAARKLVNRFLKDMGQNPTY